MAIGHSYRHFGSWIETARKNDKTFITREVGQSASIIFESGTKQRFAEAGMGKNGAHICRMLYSHIEKRLRDGEYFPKNTNNDRDCVKTIMVDFKNIEKCINNKIECRAIDISACYWNTAHIIKAMDDKMYNYGMSKGKEWKEARNVAIGSIGACIYENRYKNGKLLTPGGIHYRRPLNIVRLDVIDHVWEVANQIANQVKDGFCMYLTDCFFVMENYADEIARLLEKEGYQSKQEPAVFTNIMNIHQSFRAKKVVWKKGNIDLASDISPSHYFSDNHIIRYKPLSHENKRENAESERNSHTNPTGNTVKKPKKAKGKKKAKKTDKKTD